MLRYSVTNTTGAQNIHIESQIFDFLDDRFDENQFIPMKERDITSFVDTIAHGCYAEPYN